MNKLEKEMEVVGAVKDFAQKWFHDYCRSNRLLKETNGVIGTNMGRVCDFYTAMAKFNNENPDKKLPKVNFSVLVRLAMVCGYVADGDLFDSKTGSKCYFMPVNNN